MRSDMDKLLVTRPRWGSRCPMRGARRRRRERVDPESAPRHEPMSLGRGHKTRSEYFAPLLRFLRSRVGQRWDRVYSEIRRCIRNDSTVKAHVYVHLDQFVLRDVFLEDGKRWVIAYGEKRELSKIRSWRETFYVCPSSGRLHELRFQARRGRCELRPDARIGGPDLQLHRIDGLWFEIRLAEVPSGAEAQKRAFDRVLRAPVSRLDGERLYMTYGDWRRFGATRRALSRREIRRAQALPCVRLEFDRYDRWRFR